MATQSSDWPIDPDGDETSEGLRKYDIAVLSKFVGDEDAFPITKDELVEKFGDYPVRVNYQETISVESILEMVGVGEFETKKAFHRAIGDAFRQKGVWTYAPDAK